MLIEIGDLMSESYKLLKQYFGIYVKYVLLLITPIIAFQIIVNLLGFVRGRLAQINIATFILFIVIFFLVVAAVVLSVFLIKVAFVKTIHALYTGQPYQPVRAALRQSTRVLGKAIGVSLIVWLYISWPFLLSWLIATLIPFLLLFGLTAPIRILMAILLLGFFGYGLFHLFYHTVRLNFSVYAVIIENDGALDSLKVSRARVQNRWWSIFGRIMVPALAAIAGVLVFDILIALLRMYNTTLMSIVLLLIAVCGLMYLLLAVPFLLTCYIILYQSAKKNPPPALAAPALAPAQ